MKPDVKACQTRYCLVDPGREYLAFQFNKGEFTVDLSGPFHAEWLNVNADRIVPAGHVEGGAVRTFTTPFPGPAVLYLKPSE